MNYGFVVVHFGCPGMVGLPGEPVAPPKFQLEERVDDADQRGTDVRLVCPACDHKVVLIIPGGMR